MVIVDKGKGYALFDTLVGECVNRRFPFDRAEVPQDRKNLPKDLPWGGREHALFLFHACYWMRGGIQSGTAIKALTRVWNYNRRLFEPAYFDENEDAQEMLVRTLESVGLGFGKTIIPAYWEKNLRKMDRFWKCDPREFFSGIATYEELCLRIMGKGKWGSGKGKGDLPNGFYGFRHKMVSMITYFLIESRIIKKEFSYPVPVDFHVLRLLTSHKVLSKVQQLDAVHTHIATETLLEKARDLTQEYCVERGVDEIDLCNSLWLFSNTLCSRHPGNRSVVPKARKGRATSVTRFVFNWTKARMRNHENTCLRCPVNATCEFQVPAAYYYVKGVLHMFPKNDPPQRYFAAIMSEALTEEAKGEKNDGAGVKVAEAHSSTDAVLPALGDATPSQLMFNIE